MTHTSSEVDHHHEDGTSHPMTFRQTGGEHSNKVYEGGLTVAITTMTCSDCGTRVTIRTAQIQKMEAVAAT
jgi:hypothetical protein